MRPAVIALVVVLHLVCDLASPTMGAFRFNPSESVDGVRAEEAQTHAPARALHASAQPKPLVLTTGFVKVAPDHGHPRPAPGLVPLLPRRDASPDDAPSRSTEDH